MQEDGKTAAAIITAALINCASTLGVFALGGLLVLAFMSGSIAAMRAVTFVGGLAYLSQVCTAAAEFYPPFGASVMRDSLRLAGLLLWAVVIVCFIAGLALI